MSLMRDYSHNLVPYILNVEPDAAGPNLAEVCERYNIDPENIIKLNLNENAYGPSPLVGMMFKDVPLQEYPDSSLFLESLAKYTGYPESNIIVGAGMDEIITTISRLFLGQGDRALIPVPTYNVYEIATRLCGGMPFHWQRLSGFKVGPNPPNGMKIIFLCSPNNPTGNLIAEDTVRSIAESTDGIIFLDEAYAEFAEKSLLKLVEDYDNLVVGRTLSKAFGLAGLRLGYAVAPEWIAVQYRRIAPIFSISSLSLAAGIISLNDLKYMKETVSKIILERELLYSTLETAFPSKGNFLFIRTQEKSCLVMERLLSRGIVIKDCSSFPGAGDHFIRVTIGTPEQNKKFLLAYMESQK
jgi:histidinol-phosphate aminotransferase